MLDEITDDRGAPVDDEGDAVDAEQGCKLGDDQIVGLAIGAGAPTAPGAGEGVDVFDHYDGDR